MSKLFKDVCGQRFGRLTALYRLHNYKKSNCSYWLCVCECGNLIEVRLNTLTSGDTKSCGCLQKEVASKTHKKHGLSRDKIYQTYYHMKNRCYNRDSQAYSNYGGRGIKVCDEWLNDFKSFYDWATSNGYQDNLTIDRIDVNGNYEPNNCRWVDMKTQSNNKRTTAYYIINNKKHSLSEWCDIYNIKYYTVWARLNRGWTIEKALFTPTEK